MTVTDTRLIDTVADALDRDTEVTEDVKYVVLAALEGEAELADEVEKVVDRCARVTTSEGVEESPVGAFLSSIEVTGFRGVGPTAVLDLVPGPGITVISGRNGSGKSSFAEALEYALTSKSYRWSSNKKSVMWADSWRNIHHSGASSVRVGLTIDGQPATTVGVDWTTTATLDESKFWVQEKSAPRVPGTDSLGWRDAIHSHRPILSYDEVGRMFEQEPSVLHDAIAKLLGLDAVADADKRLTALHAELKKPRGAATQAKRSAKAAVESSTDQRAQSAFQQLRKHKPDIDVVSGIATGSEVASSSVVSALRDLSALELLSEADVEVRLARFDAARTRVSSAAGEIAGRQERLLELLANALDVHADGEAEPCPVCGEGTLDKAWAERSRTALDVGRSETQRYRDARYEFDASVRPLREVLGSVPGVGSETGGVDVEEFVAARSVAQMLPADAEAMGDHIRSTVPLLRAAIESVRLRAQEATSQLEGEWTPLAERLLRWVDLERQAREVDDQFDRVEAAKKWLADHVDVLKAERLSPIGERARHIWSLLRQESNVDIDRITLDGRTTRRRANIEASVDGQATGALSVMSQGELHALTLALFIPRATTEGSPFRFLLLDDPIQAMDPAKIDGFVDVLTELAETRQVVVFSHDDRLPAALRRRTIEARLIEVTREAKSTVRLVESQTPALRYVADAAAATKDENLPADVKRRAVQSIFRLAIEAAAWDRYVRIGTDGGTAWADLEAAWGRTHTTRKRIALALGKEPDADIGGWLSYRSWRGESLRYANTGVHGQGVTPTDEHCSDLRKIVSDIMVGA